MEPLFSGKVYHFSINPTDYSKEVPITLPPRLEDRISGKRYYSGDSCPVHDEPRIGIWGGFSNKWQRPPGCPYCDPYYAAYKRSISIDSSEVPLRYQSETLNTFTGWGVGPLLALRKAREFLAGRYSTGMIWIGGVGTGKTHLAAGIIRAWIEKKGETALYATSWNIFDTIKNTFNGDNVSSTDKAYAKYLSPSLLVIDEIGIGHQTDFEHHTLSKIILRRFDQCRPTILISNLELKELTHFIGERVIDRFKVDGEALVPFNWESLRGKKFFTKIKTKRIGNS